ncbi:MAG: pentapeptide repeat-containing protein [Pseudodesulfovibrio sp.]
MVTMRKITPKELKGILDAHALWLESSERQGERANLAFVNLTLADLHGANLQNANLRGAKLRSANLQNANLQNANLMNANLGDVSLQNTKLTLANFIGANLEGANLLGANLTLADLQGANLENANLENADLENANLRGAILVGSILEGANINNTILRSSKLYSTRDTMPERRTVSVEKSKLFHMERKLWDAEENKRILEQKLKRVSSEQQQATEEEKARLQKEKEALQAELAESKQESTEIETDKKEIEEKYERLVNRPITEAAQKMRESVKAAYRAKRWNLCLSILLIALGLTCFGTAVYYFWYLCINPDACVVSWLTDKDGIIAVSNPWQIIPVYLPVVVLLSIGTALLRHEGKIREQTSILLEQINHAEKAAGLLQIATDLEGIPQEGIILPTFIDIRRSLLNMSGKQTNGGSNESAGLPPSQVKIIAEIIAKTFKRSSSD